MVRLLHLLHSLTALMATKYPKKRSPYWSIQFVDQDGIRRNQSSGLRRDSASDTAAADVLVAELTEAEVKRGLHAGKESAGWEFVPKYLSDHCVNRPKTHGSYLNRWGWISLFLTAKKIRSPEQVKFTDAQDYVDWRTTWKKKSGKTVCRNTAILESKLFSQIVQAAVQRGLCQTNPLVRTGLQKDDVKEKPEITDEEFDIIDTALKTEPEWMRVSWEIARRTGCWLADTSIPMQHLDFAEKQILFGSPKGGRKRAFSVPMPKTLQPLLKSLRDGRKKTLTFPFQPSRQWQHFFRRVNLRHLTFHCTRVTFVTRLARRGVPLSAAMRLVNHASKLIHEIYQRLNVEDVRQYSDTAFPTPA